MRILFIFMLILLAPTTYAVTFNVATIPPDYLTTYPPSGEYRVLGPGVYSLLLEPGRSYVIMHDHLAGSLIIHVVSSLNVSIYVMSRSDYLAYLTEGSVNSLYNTEGSLINANLELPQGRYYLLINNTNQVEVAVTVYLSEDPHAPMGIADYGIFPTSPMIPYAYTTDSFVGVINITRASTYSSGYACGVPVGNSFSIQLNAVLKVATKHGNKYYWVQNGAIINPDKGFRLVSNIWNITTYPSRLEGFPRGSGQVTKYGQNDVYVHETETIGAKLPLSLTLVVKEKEGNILFGYSVNDGVIIWFDNVSMGNVDGVFVVNGTAVTGAGYPLDVELIIGGPMCGSSTVVHELDARLGLFLAWNNSLSPVPSAWSMGSITAESVYNVSVIPVSPGVVRLTASTINPGPLPINLFKPILVSGVPVNGDLVDRVYLLGNSTVKIRVPPVIYLNNRNTRLVFAGYLVGNTLVNSTEIDLDSNSPSHIKVTWLLQYYLDVIDESGYLANLSGWYTIGSMLSFTIPRELIYSNMTRLVFRGLMTNAPRYYINGNHVELFVLKPTVLTVDWIREYNVTLRLFSLSGEFLGSHWLGWLSEGYRLSSIVLNGVPIELGNIIISGPILDVKVNATPTRFLVRDSLGLPAPFASIVLNCGNHTVWVTTEITGYTPVVITQGSCSYTKPVLGYLSMIMIAAASALVMIIGRHLLQST